jgi:hypothetical protein
VTSPLLVSNRPFLTFSLPKEATMGKLNRVVAVRMDEDLLDAIGKRIELLRMRVPDGTFNPLPVFVPVNSCRRKG